MRGPERFTEETNLNEQHLLQQFDSPEKVEFGDKAIEVVDVTPESSKTETATLMMPGFSATSEALKDAILRTAEAGRRVISFKEPHGIDVTQRETELPEAEARKLELILQLVEKKGLDKVNVISNSESAIYVTAAAALYPEKFENIVFIEPAGLIGEDSFMELLKRFVQDAKEQGRQDKSKEKVKYPSPASVGIKSVLSDLFASIKEVKAIAHSNIAPALEQVHKSGIGVSIIHAVDDKIFPIERVQKMVKADMIDGFYSVSGTHNSIYSYEPFGRAAEAALSALEKKKALQAAGKLSS